MLIWKYSHAYKGGEASERTALQQDICYSILLVLTVDGYMTVCVVEGSIDGHEFNFVFYDVVFYI